MTEAQIETCPKAFKVVILGETTVGKTSIVNVATTGKFTENQLPTVSANFQVKNINIEGVNVKLNLWDTAGQERYRSLAPIFYRESDFIILVYSINNKFSFDSIHTWYENIKEDCINMPIILICGNKTDLEEERVIRTETGFELSKSMNCEFMELSAKTTPEKVDDLFKRIAVLACEKYHVVNEKIVSDIVLSPNEVLKENSNNNKMKKISCC